jgi:hypothetical protein
MVPMATLAAQFRNYGCDVTVVSKSDTVDFLKAQGLATVLIGNHFPIDRARELLRVMHCHQPDITICDWDIHFWCAVKVFRPQCTVSILRCELSKGYTKLSLLLPAKFDFHGPLLDSINAGLTEADPQSAACKSLHELFSADIIAVPSIPQVDPWPADPMYANTEVVYTGPLTLDSDAPVSSDTVAWIEDRRRERRVIVLVTLGTALSDAVFVDFIDQCRAPDVAVVITVPAPDVCNVLKSKSNTDVLVLGYAPLSTLMKLVDVIIHHGGHGTSLLALASGKPSLIVPTGEYDREDNAIRIERMRAGVLLEARWFRGRIDARSLVDKIKSVASDPEMNVHTLRVAEIVREYRTRYGPKAVVESALMRLECPDASRPSVQERGAPP